MKTLRSLLIAGLLTFSASAGLMAESTKITDHDRRVYDNLVDSVYDKIETEVLDNGMRVIVVPQSHTSKVVVSMIYDVGGEHELPREYGMAHLVEHMIFKGTKKMREGDLERLTKHLGVGRWDYNASTALDRTHYYFVTDSANWSHFIDIVADCAQNMDWDSEVLDSELGAIFQEIKLRKRDQIGTFSDLLRNWLPYNHRYAHDLIGYKEQLLNFTREDVLAFYKKYYTPDRAILMVVGNVQPAAVFEQAKKSFAGFSGSAPVDDTTPAPFYPNFAHTNRVVYHPQQFHEYCYYWQGPIKHTPEAAALDYIAAALSTRMQQEWVDQKGWCLGAGAWLYSLKKTGIIGFYARPKPDHVDAAYTEYLDAMIQDIIENGITDHEYAAAHKSFTRNVIGCAENPEQLSQVLVEGFFPDYTVKSLYDASKVLNNVSQDLIRQVAHQYLRPFLRHEVKRVPLPQEEQTAWMMRQVAADNHEKALLEQRARIGAQSNAEREDSMALPERFALEWPDATRPQQTFTLTNGLKVHYVQNSTSPLVYVNLMLKDAEAARLAWAVNQHKFAAEIWGDMVVQGTPEMNKKAFDDALDHLGAGCVATQSGIGVSCLKPGIDQACCLLNKVLTNPAFPDDILQRRQTEFAQQTEEMKNDANYQIQEHLKHTVFKPYPWNYPYDQQLLHVQATTCATVRDYHQVMTDPSRVVATVVGDISIDDARELMEKHFSSLEASAPIETTPTVPSLGDHGGSAHIELPNSEVVIRAVHSACDRDHADYPALVILDEYISRQLYDIRERTGLFYASGFMRQPGTSRMPAMLVLGTCTQPERVAELVTEIKQMLTHVSSTGVTDDELAKLKSEWLHSVAKYVRTAASQSSELAAAVQGDLSWQHMDQLKEKINALTVEQVNQAMARYFAPDSWYFVTAGRAAQ